MSGPSPARIARIRSGWLERETLTWHGHSARDDLEHGLGARATWGRLYASVTARRWFELGIRQLGRRFVCRGRGDQAHRGIALHPAAHDGDHGPLPKAVDQELAEKSQAESAGKERQPLEIATPTRLPEAIAGRSYLVALAATGGRGPLHWSVEGTVPEWLSLDEATGQLAGTPPKETGEPLTLEIGVSDGTETATQPAQLLILPFQAPSSTGAWLKRHLRAVPWRGWLEQGVGFLVLWLVHLLGMNLLANLERGSLEESMLALQGPMASQLSVQKRFAAYRLS